MSGDFLNMLDVAGFLAEEILQIPMGIFLLLGGASVYLYKVGCVRILLTI